MKVEVVFLSAILLVGLLDWLTTVAGVLFCGASEVNPLLSGLAKSSLLVFSLVKLTAVTLVGFTFYKGASVSKTSVSGWNFTKGFLYGGYSLTFLALTAIVGSNMIELFRA